MLMGIDMSTQSRLIRAALVLAISGAFAVQPPADAQERDELVVELPGALTLRESLGFSSKPAQVDGKWRGIEFADSELKALDAYYSAIEANTKLQKTLETDPGILNAFIARNINPPTMEVTLADGYSIDQTAASSLREFKLEVASAPVPRTARDDLWIDIMGGVYSTDAKVKANSLTEMALRSGVSIQGVSLGGPDWRVRLGIVGDLNSAAKTLRELPGFTYEGTPLFVVEPYEKAVYATGNGNSTERDSPGHPWLTPAQQAPPDMARGGKHLSDTSHCTTGPTMTTQNTPELITTAGHCFLNGTGTEANVPPFPTDRVGTAGVYMGIACDRCVSPGAGPINWNNPPQWWWGQGVDVSLLFYTNGNPTQRGYNRSWFVWGDANGDMWYDRQAQQGDMWNGQQPVCVEGATDASAKPQGYWQKSMCGVANGSSQDDFRQVNLYMGERICGGDSGSLVNVPSYGYAGRQYGATINGLLSAMAFGTVWTTQYPITSGPNIGQWGPVVNGCRQSNAQQATTVYVSSMWKIHNYLAQYRALNAWVLTY
jgi:hypothetical protein